ncbi:ABC transporter ATP-binding protein [bacterium]|nr:ABC transporter ATP-binding protein [bacterium]
MSTVVLKNLKKSFGEVAAVNNISLRIQQGEFFSLLGPSGCGKTTTLRMIAGFEFPTSGSIFFDDRDVTFLAPNKRNTGMVFQNYALFPHMTVFENVAFGLRARKVAKSEIEERVRRALDLVELGDLPRRSVTELSGGQQQRVALARSIVIEPSILLLDEPLSNLDTKLREETRMEIRNLQQRLGITAIYVTHDQEEALALSDRIAVLNKGVCHQVGTPDEIFSAPKDRFVARFVGDSNVLEGTFRRVANGSLQIEIDPDWQLQLNANADVGSLVDGECIEISVRPEFISVANGSTESTNLFEGVVQKASHAGSIADYQVDCGKQTFRVRRLLADPGQRVDAGDKAWFRIDSSKITILN